MLRASSVLLRATLASLLLCLLRTVPGAGQSPPVGEGYCRPADAVSLQTEDQLRQVLSGTDSANADLRGDVGITYQPSPQVAHVADESICELAVSALNRRTRTPGKRRQVYVFDLGAQFAVEDPEQMAGELRMVRVFSREWQLRGDILIY
jgi:hypothetical protein